jgi:hypothetical protein
MQPGTGSHKLRPPNWKWHDSLTAYSLTTLRSAHMCTHVARCTKTMAVTSLCFHVGALILLYYACA